MLIKLKAPLLLVFAVGGAVCVGWYLAMTDVSPNAHQNFRTENIHQLGHASGAAVIIKKEDESNAPLPSTLTQGKSISELLAEYDLTGDPKLLESALRKGSSQPELLVLAALASKYPSSDALNLLEKNQPNNALPNLLRAGMYAKKGDLTRLKEQLELALSKSELTLYSRNRKSAMLDLLISDPEKKPGHFLIPKSDNDFFSKGIDPITEALRTQSSAFGGAETAAALGLSLAAKLRGMSDYDLTSKISADSMELELLMNVDQEMFYGNTEQTVRQRMEEISSQASTKNRQLRLWNMAIDPNIDKYVRTQFLVRVRADGETAALNWLDEKFGFPKNLKPLPRYSLQ